MPPADRPALTLRLRASIRRLLGRDSAAADATFRRRLIRDGAAPHPQPPDPVWRSWQGRPLRDRDEADQALAAVTAAGLPPHQDRPKNWDLLIALGSILERTAPSAAVLEMGATRYSRLLPWLFLYGYRSLHGIDLVHEGPMSAGPIRYDGMDLTATTFADSSFDAIACLSVIEHGVDLGAYVRESARLLRPGGILVTSTDFWCEPVDTGGREAYGVPIRILAPADIRRCLELAAAAGLQPVTPVSFDCVERAVRWERFGLDYTFLAFVLEKPA